MNVKLKYNKEEVKAAASKTRPITSQCPTLEKEVLQ